MSIVSLQSGSVPNTVSVPSTYSSTRYQSKTAQKPVDSVPVIRKKAEQDIVKFMANDSIQTLSAASDSSYDALTSLNTAINQGMRKHVCVNQDQFPSEKFVITSEYVEQSAGKQDYLTENTNVGNIAGVANIAKTITSQDSVPMYDSSYLVKIDAGSNTIQADILASQFNLNTYNDKYTVVLSSNNSSSNNSSSNNSDELNNRFKALCNPLNIDNMNQSSNGENVIGAFIQESDNNSNNKLLNDDFKYIHRDPTNNKLVGTYADDTAVNNVTVGHSSLESQDYVITEINNLPNYAGGSYKLVYQSVNANISIDGSAPSQNDCDALPFGVHSAENLSSSVSVLNGSVLPSSTLKNLTEDYFSAVPTEIRYGFNMDVEVTQAASNPGYQGKTSALNNVPQGETNSSEVFTLDNSALVNNDKYMYAIWENGSQNVEHRINILNGDVVLDPVSNQISVQRQAEHLGDYSYSNNGLVRIENKATSNRVDVLNAVVNASDVSSGPIAAGLQTDVFYETTDPSYDVSVGVLNNTQLTTEFIVYDVTCLAVKPSDKVVGSDCIGKSGNSALIKREFSTTVGDNINNDTLSSANFTFTEDANAVSSLANNEIQWVDIQLAMDMVQDGVIKGFVSSSETKSNLAANYFENQDVLATNLDLSLLQNDLRLVMRNKTVADLPSLSSVNWSWSHTDTNEAYLYSTKSKLGVQSVIDDSTLKSWITYINSTAELTSRRSANITLSWALKVSNVSSSGVKDQNDILSYHVTLDVSSDLPNSINPTKLVLDLSNPTSVSGNEYTFSGFKLPVMIGNFNNLSINIPSFTLRKEPIGSNIDIVFVNGSSTSHDGPSSNVVFKYYDFFTMVSKFQSREVTSTEGGVTAWSDVTLMSESEGLTIANDSSNFHTDVNYGIETTIKIDDLGVDANIHLNLDINHVVADAGTNYKQKEFVLDMRMRNTTENALIATVSGQKYTTNADVLSLCENNSVFQSNLPTDIGSAITVGSSALNVSLSTTNDTVTIVVKYGTATWYTIVGSRNIFQQLRIISQKEAVFKLIEAYGANDFISDNTKSPSVTNISAVFGAANNKLNLNDPAQNIGTLVSGILISYPASTVSGNTVGGIQEYDNYSVSLLTDNVKVALYYLNAQDSVGVSNYSTQQLLSSNLGLGLVAYDRTGSVDNARSVTFARWRNNLASRPSGLTPSNKLGNVDYTLTRTTSQVSFVAKPDITGSTEYIYNITTGTDRAPMYQGNVKTNIPCGGDNSTTSLGNLGLKITFNCSMISNDAGARLYTLDVNPDTYTVTYSASTGATPARSDGKYTLSSSFSNSSGNVTSNYKMHTLPSSSTTPALTQWNSVNTYHKSYPAYQSNNIRARRVFISNGKTSTKYTIKIDQEGQLTVYHSSNVEKPQNVGNYSSTSNAIVLSTGSNPISETQLDASFTLNGYTIKSDINNTGFSDFYYIDSTAYFQTYDAQIRLVYPDVRAITSLPYSVIYPVAGQNGQNGSNYREWYLDASSNALQALPDSDASNTASNVVNAPNNLNTPVYVSINHPQGKTKEQYLQGSDSTLRFPLRPETNKLTIKMFYGLNGSSNFGSQTQIDTLFDGSRFIGLYDVLGDSIQTQTESSFRSKKLSVTYNATLAEFSISYVQYNDSALNPFSSNSNLNPNSSTEYNVFFKLGNPYLLPGNYYIQHDVKEGVIFNVYGSRFVSDTNGLSFVIEKYTTATNAASNMGNITTQGNAAIYEDIQDNILNNNGDYNSVALNNSTAPQRLTLTASEKRSLTFNLNSVVGITNSAFNAANTYASAPVIDFTASCNNLRTYINNNVSSWVTNGEVSWIQDNAYAAAALDMALSPLSNYGTQIIVQALVAVTPLIPYSLLTVYQPDLYKVLSEDNAPVFRIRHNGSLLAVRQTTRVVELAPGPSTTTYEHDYVMGNVVDF